MGIYSMVEFFQKGGLFMYPILLQNVELAASVAG
jgi:hypothetical protein